MVARIPGIMVEEPMSLRTFPLCVLHPADDKAKFTRLQGGAFPRWVNVVWEHGDASTS